MAFVAANVLLYLPPTCLLSFLPLSFFLSSFISFLLFFVLFFPITALGVSDNPLTVFAYCPFQISAKGFRVFPQFLMELTAEVLQLSHSLFLVLVFRFSLVLQPRFGLGSLVVDVPKSHTIRSTHGPGNNSLN